MKKLNVYNDIKSREEIKINESNVTIKQETKQEVNKKTEAQENRKKVESTRRKTKGVEKDLPL